MNFDYELYECLMALGQLEKLRQMHPDGIASGQFNSIIMDIALIISRENMQPERLQQIYCDAECVNFPFFGHSKQV